MSATEPTPERTWQHTGLEPTPQPKLSDPPPQPETYHHLPPSRPTSGYAIAAFVLGLLGFGIIAVIFGHVALGEIKRTGKDGRGLAIAGLWLGYIVAALWTLLILTVVLL